MCSAFTTLVVLLLVQLANPLNISGTIDSGELPVDANLTLPIAEQDKITIAPSPTSLLLDQVTCVRDKQCVFEFTELINQSRITKLYPSVLEDKLCQSRGCLKPTKSCSACQDVLTYVQEHFRLYFEAEGRYQTALRDSRTSPVQSSVLERAKQELENTVNELLAVCPCISLVCRDGGCKYVSCNGFDNVCATTTTVLLTSQPATSYSTGYSTESPLTTTASASLSEGDKGGPNVVAIALGAGLTLLVVAGLAAVVIFWWRRKRGAKGRKADHGRNATASNISEEADRRDHISREADNGGFADNRLSDHEYNYIPADLLSPIGPPSSTAENNHGVTNRKLPPAPAQNGGYSLARYPSPSEDTRPPAPLPSVYDVARDQSNQYLDLVEGPSNQYLDLVEDPTAEASVEERGTTGQYFILEEGAVAGASDPSRVDGHHPSHDDPRTQYYSPLNPADRTGNETYAGQDSGSAYTALRSTIRQCGTAVWDGRLRDRMSDGM